MTYLYRNHMSLFQLAFFPICLLVVFLMTFSTNLPRMMSIYVFDPHFYATAVMASARSGYDFFFVSLCSSNGPI